MGLLMFTVWVGTIRIQDSGYTRGEFVDHLKNDQVAIVKVCPNKNTDAGALEITLKSGTERRLNVTNVSEAEDLARSYGLDPVVESVPEESWFLNSVLPILIVVVVCVFFFVMMNAQNASGGGGNGKMMNFGRSRAKLTLGGENKIKLDGVAGLKEEKEELQEIVEFLREPGKFTKVGARIPKGVLLEGAPGTGKTLLAKAIAGEANVPFFSISGSDFVEMFVGVGASRVRDMFAEAKRHAPCIIFIDEIDAVARRRGTGMGGGHDEREQTLNQLLVEMDGFGVNEGIIVMAATNRVDILDPAILRPGRFDRKITVAAPDVRGREDILKVHAQNKPLGDDVDLSQIAQTTAGFTGADLENLLNEAAINAAMDKRVFVKQDDIKRAFVKVGIGAEKKSRIISDKEKKITAYHEAGHAILFHVLPDVGPVYTVSIIPTGIGAAGYTMPLPEKDEMFLTKGKMFQDIMVSLGGRIAEEIIFDDITTGASSDIKKATKVARRMVTRYGMSANIGVINYDDDDDEVFIGRDLAHAKSHSEAVSGEIDREVKAIIDDCYEKAKAIILEQEDVLHRCAELLLQKEKINRTEFEALFDTEYPQPEAPEMKLD
ncbi:MAG: ATP-dependent zinc metalloprotease FtsH [Lachnospiraceae bacterium]|nr:ATP-dependent zinc metalloprotease FtsH [Lachnospiraceae bacterium]MCI8985656.1 ATP-dependent zinc metalloprotease FtsH [Lachnospiraceae bacterium]MCI9013165.1 ATP-dependent zinc metalloprotease FtsH [Lachnospiraceae bacterium]MCI9255227.1 ATP-dependent zinc metalloprotease FtsH [Lachnospiraceae bacterium]